MLIGAAIRRNSGYFDLPILPEADRANLKSIVEELDRRLEGCTAADIGAMLATLMAEYPNHSIADDDTMQLKMRVAMQVLSDVPGWLLGHATFEAIRQTAQSPNERDRRFMPTAAMIRAAALPELDRLKAERMAAHRLYERSFDGEAA